jgi:hypothetical protein
LKANKNIYGKYFSVHQIESRQNNTMTNSHNKKVAKDSHNIRLFTNNIFLFKQMSILNKIEIDFIIKKSLDQLNVKFLKLFSFPLK